MGKRGPKASGGYERKTIQIGPVITADLYAYLKANAAKNGNSLSSEVEERLRRSRTEERELERRFGGREMYALAQIFVQVMQRAARASIVETRARTKGHRSIPADEWMRDPFAFDQSCKAIAHVLEQLRPEGDPSPPRELIDAFRDRMPDLADAIEQSAPNIGTRVASNFLAALAGSELLEPLPALTSPDQELAQHIANALKALPTPLTGARQGKRTRKGRN
jgi:hypothetical protein